MSGDGPESAHHDPWTKESCWCPLTTSETQNFRARNAGRDHLIKTLFFFYKNKLMPARLSPESHAPEAVSAVQCPPLSPDSDLRLLPILNCLCT